MEEPETKPPTTFLSLPAEIRNEIYILADVLSIGQGSFEYDVDQKLHHGTRHVPGYPDAISMPGSLSLWLNRNSNLAKRGCDAGSSDGHAQSLRTAVVDCKKRLEGHVDHIEQPAITKVCKRLRNDALPMFYGRNDFMFTFFNEKVDGASIFKWLRIEKANVPLLRTLKIVYRKKEHNRYLLKSVLPGLTKLGFKGTLVVRRLGYPFCYCEGCIRRTLKEI